MIVEFPFFGAGINYFPTEISALRVFEPRYLLLIGDCINNESTFCVGKNYSVFSRKVLYNHWITKTIVTPKFLCKSLLSQSFIDSSQEESKSEFGLVVCNKFILFFRV